MTTQDIRFNEAQLRWLELMFPEQCHEVTPDRAIYHRGQRSVIAAVRERTQFPINQREVT